MTKKTRRGRAKAASQIPAPPARRRFRQRLLSWYGRHGRDLPWRRTDDPYHILVSEIMLQQTQVDRVLPKYAEWLDKFPSLEALAEADETHVTETWRPLGYNIRPRRLQAIAREAVDRYDGRLPDDEETLLSFKGIGRYTAGAIRSFGCCAASRALGARSTPMTTTSRRACRAPSALTARERARARACSRRSRRPMRRAPPRAARARCRGA